MDTENDLPASDGRYDRSDYEDEPNPVRRLYWPWLVLIGLAALTAGVLVALVIG
jgi:hypothetical protein